MSSRVIPWILGTTLAASAACKPKVDRSEVLDVTDDDPLDAMAAVEAQKIADACEGKSDAFFRGKGRGDEIEFLWHAGVPATGTTGNQLFFEKGRFDGKNWKLSSPMFRAFKGRECASRDLLSSNDLITALGCADGELSAKDFCDAETKVAPAVEGNAGFGLTASAPEGGLDWTWGDCSNGSQAFHLTKMTGAKYVCEDRINTLYSWGPVEKVAWLKGHRWNGRFWWNNRNWQVFTIQSPTATHGYGQVPIRFKLKQGVKWRYEYRYNGYQVCDVLSAAELENTVVVRYLQPGAWTALEFILCGLGPVESWSVGTDQHKKEMDNEIAWIDTHDYKSYELYVKQNGVDVVEPHGLDGLTFYRAHLLAKLADHAAKSPGEVHVNPTMPASYRDEAFAAPSPNHFQSKNGTAVVPTPVKPETPTEPAAGPVNVSLETLVGRFQADTGSEIWFDRGKVQGKWFNYAQRFDLTCATSGGQLACRAGDPWSTPVTIAWMNANQVSVLRNGYNWTPFMRQGDQAAGVGSPVNAAVAPQNTNLGNLTGKFYSSRNSYVFANAGTFEVQWFNEGRRTSLDCGIIQNNTVSCTMRGVGTSIQLQFVHANQINVLRAGYNWTGFSRAAN